MMNESIGSTIMRLRKEHGMTQDQLAGALGITFQAVSKWENGISSPDISTLPLLADLFGVSVDQLLGREELPPAEKRMSALTPASTGPEREDAQPEDTRRAAEVERDGAPEEEACGAGSPSELPWPDDDCFYAVLYHGRSLIGHLAADPDLSPAKKHFVFSYEGPVRDIVSDFSVEVEGDVHGSIKAGESISCGDVGGSAEAGSGLSCGDVEGDVYAGSGIECGAVSGDLTAGGSVSCEDVEGSVKAGGNVKAGDVEGSVSAGGNVKCGDVGGSVTAGISASCGNVDGSVISGYGGSASGSREDAFDRDLDELIDGEIEKAQAAAESASIFGEELGRRISDAVQRTVSLGIHFGRKNRNREP